MTTAAPDVTTYVVGFDPDTAEYVADAGGQQYASEHGAGAYHWLAAQILADEAASPTPGCEAPHA